MRAVVTRERRWLVAEWNEWAVWCARREPSGGVRERAPVLAAAASGQAKHHPVYPGTRTVRGAIWDCLGGAWRLTEDALLKSERLRFIYSRNGPWRVRSRVVCAVPKQ